MLEGLSLRENLPHNVTFTPTLPIFHAHDLGGIVSDTAIWQRARNDRLVIVSKDADFSNRILFTAPPPWIVHLRFGNLRRTDYHAALARLWPAVEALLRNTN